MSDKLHAIVLRDGHQLDLDLVPNLGRLWVSTKEGMSLLSSVSGGAERTHMKYILAETANKYLTDRDVPNRDRLVAQINNWARAGGDITGPEYVQISKQHMLILQINHPEDAISRWSFAPVALGRLLSASALIISIFMVFRGTLPLAVEQGLLAVWLYLAYKWLPRHISRVFTKRASYLWSRRRFDRAIKDMNTAREWHKIHQKERGYEPKREEV